MQIQQKQLNSLSSIQLTPDEAAIVKWMRSVTWEPQKDEREPLPYKAKVPEFFGGVRLYRVQGGASTGGGALGPLDLFIKKIEHQGIISKQGLYPVTTQGTARYLSLRKTDLDNLGIGQSDEDDE